MNDVGYVGMMIVAVDENSGSVWMWRPGNSTVLIKDLATLEDLDCFSVDIAMSEDEMIRYCANRIEEQYEEEPEDDGQPTEYEEWQDFMGGDDWDHGQYDEAY